MTRVSILFTAYYYDGEKDHTELVDNSCPIFD